MNPYKRLKTSLWVAALVALPFAANAGAPTPIDPEALKLDQQVGTLKNEVLQLNRALNAQEQALLYPAFSRTDIYVNIDVRGFLLTDMLVSIDGGTPFTFAYTERQSTAFTDGGWHRLARTNVTQGPHRLHAEFTGHYITAKPGDPPIHGSLETSFNKQLASLDIVLPLAGLGQSLQMDSVQRLQAPSTLIDSDDASQQWKLDNARVDYRLGSVGDPRLKAAQFYETEGRYFTALTELLNIADEAGSDDSFSQDYFWLLAECYLSFGLKPQAEAVYDRLAQMTQSAPETLGRARLRIAEFEYERGYLPEATRDLMRLRETLPQALLIEWQDLLSRVLMEQGRYNEAVEVLTELDNIDEHTPFMEYNLGVAMVNDGRVAQGRNLLDRVGRMRPKTVKDLALRDRANLALGYSFLRNELGGSAIPAFNRVQVEGPFSNRALLGLGWSQLAPRGDLQNRAAIGDEDDVERSLNAFSSLGVLIRPGYLEDDLFKRSALRPFARGKVAKEAEEALLRALVPWVELVKRDRMDPAVQEGMLAIPYALERLGAHEQALDRYLIAIKTLEEGRSRIDEGIESLNKLAMIETIVRRDVDAESGWDWRLRDLPDLPETYWLTSLLSEHRFQEALKNYRDLRFLARRLDTWEDRLQRIESGARAVPPVPADLLIAARRSRDWLPQDLPGIRLRSSDHLGTVSEVEGADSAPAKAPVELSLADAPPAFDGPSEKLAVTVPDIDRLRPLLSDIGTAQAAWLRDLGVKELEAQKQQLEKYLLEARFSMARIYDHKIQAEDSAAEGEE
ncbi:hypothetical protein RM530_12920 [Algiphilus sp. W345]|uniref:Tetratricopeptide repeat protein n=1 Tax=Banduia mediterranea TaxID=3075609 RepID=A0ABU2WK56_9GAMM|nr:hypothetical protein [Algiphilus sp. W345]MDT0498261.1 hypothetical protein [Algiphilus sp. W345]